MIGPYQMVAINLISSLIVLGGTIFYRYVFPKKKINLFVLLLIISILPIISIFRAGAYESGDFNIQIYRMMSFYNSLKEGILIPSWAADLNATYGNPLFIFNYSLSYYFICFLHFLGVSFITSTKIYLALTLYLSGIFMYLFMHKISKNNLVAFTASIFYVFVPYHLIDVHFRATFGESAIFTITPLLFLFIFKFHEKNKFIYLLVISIISVLMISSHPVLAIIFLGIAFLYISLLELTLKRFKAIILVTLALIVGGLSTMYLWAPYIIYSPYMFKFSDLPNHAVDFYNFSLLFYSPWRLGLLFQGPKGELAQIIGYTQLLVVALFCLTLARNKVSKKIKPLVMFWLGIFFVFLALMNPLSALFWNNFPASFTNMLTAYGRLSLVLAFCTSVIAGYFVLNFATTPKRKILVIVLIIVTIGYTILNWGQRRVIPEINDATLEKNVPYSTAADEGTTAYFLNNRWADVNHFWFTKIPQQHLEIIEGKGTVRELKRTSIEHDYIVNAQTPLIIRENTLYYPGWVLTSNSKTISIYPGVRGIMNARLPKGQQNIILRYDDLSQYKLTKQISIFLISSQLVILLIYLSLTLLPRKQ